MSNPLPLPYYQKGFSTLEMYQMLIQYWNIMFSRRNELYILDNMNFSRKVFPEIITIAELQALHEIEPGYISPDGFVEAHETIRHIERVRLLQNSLHNIDTIDKLVQQAGIGCGNGCSNVMNAILYAILKRFKESATPITGKPEIMLVLPNYTVYTAQVVNLKHMADYKYIHTKRENNFLMTFDEFRAGVTDKTAAVVVTYPTNPSQATYEGENVAELRKIVAFCQAKGIFLVVDNIYQDLIFPLGRPFTEIFSLTDSLDYVIKVYGSSKDTPYFSGYRTGYWFGDPYLMESYKFYISSTENSLNLISLGLFLINLYLKSLTIERRQPTVEDMALFSHGVFGWLDDVIPQQLHHNFMEMDLLAKYQERIARSNHIQAEAIHYVRDFAQASPAFSDYINQDIGNLFFLKIDERFFQGSHHDFFKFLYGQAHCGALPGNVFGMPNVPGEVWMRITLIHDHIDNIIEALSIVEEALVKPTRLTPNWVISMTPLGQ